MSKKKSLKNKKDLIDYIDSIFDTLENYDVFSKSIKSIENMLNWFIAVGVGLFLAIFSNIDKLRYENQIPEKHILVISLILIGLGSAIISSIRILLFLREYIIITAKGVINKIRFKIKKESNTDSDFDNFEKQCKTWLKITDKSYSLLLFLREGIFLIVIGVFIFIGYFIYVIIRYQ